MDPNTRWKISTPKEAAKELSSRIPWNKTGANAKWWDSSVNQFPALGGHGTTSPNDWFGNAMFRAAIEGGNTVLVRSWEGHLITHIKSLSQTIENTFKCRLVHFSDSGFDNGRLVFSGDQVMIAIDLNGKGRQAYLSMVTTSTEFVQSASVLFDRVIIPDDPKRGIIFTLAKGMGGYSLNRLGLAGSTLERGNYNPETISDYDHVIQDLKTESPCGRLIVLSGTPGSGKTFMVRGILTEVTQAAFVLVPSQLVQDISGPDLLPTFTSAKSEFNGPLVLVIEDADKVLVNRKNGDMTSISSMLNLGDGILGSILDIRILATTNAETLDMDPAIRRKGRLCRHMVIDELEPAQASQVFERLTKTKRTFTKATSLAEVYSLARDNGWVPPPATSKEQGYGENKAILG